MKYKVAELEGVLLDAAVAQAQGKRWKILPAENNEPLCCCFDEAPGIGGPGWVGFRPSTEWQQGGPIIEREWITLTAMWPDGWYGQWSDGPAEIHGSILDGKICGEGWAICHGQIPLIAAMRAFVASKFGEEIELP